MDEIGSSLSNASWENPFSLSGDICPSEINENEKFFGDELKAFFDKEEKMYQSTSSSAKSDHSQAEKSSAMASGITIRSFMVESGDSDLIHQKLTMSQYLAYKSEPMGQLGDSVSFSERPYFSFQERSLPLSNNEKSEPGAPEFDPDFTQDPSWLKKKSLSSLSSSENLDIPSKSPDNSENWLLSQHKSTSSNHVLENSSKSDLIGNVEEPSRMVSEKSYVSDHCEPSMRREQEKPIERSKVENSPPVPSVEVHEVGETSELPSLYWKPHDDESHLEMGCSNLESKLEKGTSQFHSYVAGHVESLSVAGSDNSRRPSEIAASSRSSSPASTIRENTDFPRCDSIISEPQLSSTREITDDFTDMSVSGKHVHFLTDSQRPDVSRISSEKHLRLDTLLEPPSKPNLCSTAMTPAAKASEHMMRVLANLSAKEDSSVHESNHQLATSLAKALDLETTENNLDMDWQRLERDLTQNDPAGLSPESWVAIFSNTSSLSTPLLMNKIKEHVLRLHGRGMSSDLLPSQSSGIGGSGFETTESRINSAFGLPTNKFSSNNTRTSLDTETNVPYKAPSNQSNLNQQEKQIDAPRLSFKPQISTPTAEGEGKYLKGRHTLSVMPPHFANSGIGSHAQTPVEVLPKGEQRENNFAMLTSTVIKKVPAQVDAPKPSAISKAKSNLMDQQLSSQAPLVKCNKSHVYFGGAKIRQTQKQNLVVRNSSFKQKLELELRIKDSDAFYMLEADQSLVTRRLLQLEPRQESSIDLVFQPHGLGQLATKLNLYPRCESAKKVKYTVDLYGYGGCSHVQQLVHHSGAERTLIPKSKGSYWQTQFVLENRGSVSGFAFIQPILEEGVPLEPYQCIVMPQCCMINAGDLKEIQVFIHPLKDVKFGSFKLNVVWGDEPLRSRWIKCISQGSAIRQQSETIEIDWTRLLHMDPSENQFRPAVSEEDMGLFFNNVKMDEIHISLPDNHQDSHFVTLAAEPATVLEASTSSDLSQRRLTASVGGKPPSNACVTAGVTELIFPSTNVGTSSLQKIPLQNWTQMKQEVRVKDIVGPFSMKHARSAVPGCYYTRLPIQFNPTKVGPHCGRIVLEVGTNGQCLSIALKGDAF